MEILAEQNEWLKQRFFGRSSEALSLEEQRQLKLFAEAEAAAAEPEGTQGQPNLVHVPEHVRQRPKRRALPQALPRVEVIIDIPEEQKRCGCGAELVRIDEESSEKLDVIPQQVRVIRTIRPMYACHVCGAAHPGN